MRNLFVSLEGLSACGKSTVGGLVAEKLGGLVYKTPSHVFAASRATVDKEANNISRFLFYLAGVIQSSLEIEVLLEKQIVVCDRYLATTVCYHKAIGVPVDDIIHPTLFQRITKPDQEFLVVCDDVERLARLQKRGLSHNDQAERRSGIEERFVQEYRKSGLIEIDNSCDDPNVAADMIISHIRKG